MTARWRVALWLVGLLVGSGAIGRTYFTFVEQQRAVGRLQAALAQDSAEKKSLLKDLKTLERTRPDTLRITKWKTRYVARRDRVRAAIDTIAAATAVRAQAIARADTATLAALPPLPTLDPALVRATLDDADSTDTACSDVRLSCARENAVLRRLRRSDSLTIGTLTAQLPSRRDRLRESVTAAAGGALLTLLLEHVVFRRP